MIILSGIRILVYAVCMYLCISSVFVHHQLMFGDFGIRCQDNFADQVWDFIDFILHICMFKKMKIERCRLTHLKCWFNVAYKLRWCSKKYHGKPFVLWQLCLVNDGLFLAKLASWFATIIAMNQHFYVEWRFPKMGVPPNGWFIMENQSINGWLGGTPILGNPHIWVIVSQNSTPMGSITIPLRRLNPIWFMYDGHCISYLMVKHG